MTALPTIEIPKETDETPRAYAARVEYLTLGEARSLEKLRQKIGTRSVRYLEQWSAAYHWQEHAERYDQALAALATQKHAAEYLADLEEHRTRYQKTGKALHGVAGKMLERLNAQLPHMELNATTLATITKAMQVAADLEAHALRIGDLLPKLSDDVHD